MKIFIIVLIICFYIISQTTIDARPAGLRKTNWPLQTNGDYQGDLLHQRFDRRRQAGWGKRRDLINEDDDDDLLFYHPYASHEYTSRAWFDDK